MDPISRFPISYRSARAVGLSALVLLAIVMCFSKSARACPFCAVESQTLSEEIAGSDVAVLARLVKEAPTIEPPVDDLGEEGVITGNATFEIVETLRGEDKLNGTRQIEVVFFGEPTRDQLFLIPGISAEQLEWTTPLPLSEAAVDYVRQLQALPPAGHDRLKFFQDYFEHDDPLLAQDAYDEFARAPYADVETLGSQMPHDKLIEWIQDPEVSPSRRRLYLTMLGVCGKKSDLPLLEEMITSDYESKKPFVESHVFSGLAMGGPVALPSWIELIHQDERRKKLGLDALVACYLVLRGPEGLDLVDAELLENPGAEYTHIYSTIMALRFHGDETDALPRERLLASMRLLLDNPDFADQVIIDLSRWEDWSVLDRLVSMFKTSDEKGYVRQPIVTYLTVASEQEGAVGTQAAAALEDLEEFDPESVKRARSLMAFGFLGRARAAAGDGSNAARPESTTSSQGEDATESAATETKIAFAASSADIAEAQTDLADIPDPATYGSVEASTPPVNDATANNEPDDEASSEQASMPDDKPAPNTKGSQSDAASSGSATDVDSPPNPLLIVGLPLVASVMLMALYWWILRSGAV